MNISKPVLALIILIALSLGVGGFVYYQNTHRIPAGNMLIPDQTHSTSTPVQSTTTEPVKAAPFSQGSAGVNRDCLISAENFYEAKRATDLELYSSSWEAHYEESSRMCFVQINKGIIYDVATGNQYRLNGNVFTKVSS